MIRIVLGRRKKQVNTQSVTAETAAPSGAQQDDTRISIHTTSAAVQRTWMKPLCLYLTGGYTVSHLSHICEKTNR